MLLVHGCRSIWGEIDEGFMKTALVEITTNNTTATTNNTPLSKQLGSIMQQSIVCPTTPLVELVLCRQFMPQHK
jgi:hypothetical protein